MGTLSKDMCPVQTLETLFKMIPLKGMAPLFRLFETSVLNQTLIQKRLQSILCIMQLPLVGYGFHTFRRPATSIAYKFPHPFGHDTGP